MKTIKTILGVFVLGIMLTTVSCKDAKKETKTNETEEVAKKGKEHTSAYVCPMHCEGSGSEMEGECPKCGMDYVKKEEHNANEHKH
ncbi:heavy metal-binding domain-containing protein [Tenacibaculum sp. HL-MS23]|uniref:heavy metal-binding domain-containing protein n=1 Tax=Tenacibaculum TaxID=104267 RepID=UPI0023AF15A7|nr:MULTISPECIES: heavy metal-binding domain-containing protein [Tenacibaculum]WNW02501.1 heavy metal-binding domain-containing protein [Tenacibaculum sp. HL-MS23]